MAALPLPGERRSDLRRLSKLPWVGRWIFRNHWLKDVGEDVLEDFQPQLLPWEQRIAVAIGLKSSCGREGYRQDRGNRSLQGIVHRASPAATDRVRCLHSGDRAEPGDSSASTCTSGAKVSVERINIYKGSWSAAS
jgi:hypothetical protein